MSAAQQTGKTAYRVKAESVEACNCQHGCNCQFDGFPNEGKCEFIIGYEVRDGRFGNVSLNGMRAVVAAKYPNAIHEGVRAHAKPRKSGPPSSRWARA
jgi:hypothetical protein